MRHKGCGGEIKEDRSVVYPCESTMEDERTPVVSYHPRLVCGKCGKEITGDAQIETEEE